LVPRAMWHFAAAFAKRAGLPGVTANPHIRVGIAGWSYPDWKGIVYPASCKDPLRYCAELVDVIEINSTFYRPPVAKHSAAWIERTRDLPVVFTAKLPQEFTHAGNQDAQLFAEAREGFAPLAESGRLEALLAQFSHGFVRSAENERRLRRI